ncbi:MAG: hypothetical protein A2W91_13985 [Bacteroidetes bacterium GWF2_38_335]|nr:MAG: hypothetical protein A2W91_13985 [Bacteroidetes bacterium GWF2_38_335]OFY77824.1 MAG: hypothetical protein A2281_15675 [Bacteroidetes bacterium RIFOXYA12_FULL_38_20]HBS87368.1 hypothetical protein [Bacteroidales bacterium]
MKLPKLAIENYQFTVIVFIVAIIFGVNSYIAIPRTENPTIFIPGATVLVIYPGASPVDLEKLIASPIEESVNELNDIKKISTKIMDGIVAVTVEFDYNTDAKGKYDEVVQKINSLKNTLPKEIMKLDIWQFTSSDVAMIQIALVSDTAEYYELEAEAKKLKKRVEKVSGVKKVEIFACPEREVRVSLDLEKMAMMNISIDQVGFAVQSYNANIPGGSINLSGKNFGIKTSGSYENLEEIRNSVVGSYLGKIIYLKDIAKVDLEYEDLNYLARFNGKKAIFVTIKQKADINIFSIMDDLDPVIDKYSSNLNNGIKLEYVFRQSEIVESRLNDFNSNLIEGMILVGLIMLLTLGFKSSIIIILAIPLSILIGVGIIYTYGLGLQQITIASLIVALGMLVDNSIVMMENITRFISLGYKPRDAAIKGASEIAWPVINSTITTVLAFIPIWLMPDKAGDFIKGLPVTIIATLSISLIISLTLNPMMGALLYKSKGAGVISDSGFGKQGFLGLIKKFIQGPYRKTLAKAIKHKYLTLTIAFGTLLGSAVFGIKTMDVSFFPASETPQLMIRVNLPEGASVQQTDSVVRYVESVLDTVPEIKHYASNIGHGNPRIYYNVFSKSFTKNFGDIYAQTYEYEPVAFENLIRRLRQTFSNYPGADIHVKEFEQGIPNDATIMVYINGENIDTLTKYAAIVEEMLHKSPGAINVENQLSRTRTDIYFNINKEKANLLGVPVHEIDKTIRVALAGAEISQYRDIKGDDYKITVRLPVNGELQLQDFDKVWVKSLTGKFIPISQLASIEFKKAPGIITRHNLERTAIVTADVELGYFLDDITNPIMEKLDAIEFPEGYSYRFGGELEGREEAFGGMGNALIIAIIAIFAVLVLQFRSFIQPFIIFTAFPLGGIGMIWALYLSGNPFSFTAFVGFISLAGIVVNNSIILIDYSNIMVRNGRTVLEAIKEAGETRFTPILLTTLTTIGGLLPLCFQGGDMWAPMAWTIVGGLLVSTILTLIIVPILYLIFTKNKTQNI